MSTVLSALIALAVIATLWWVFFSGIRADMEAIAQISAHRTRQQQRKGER